MKNKNQRFKIEVLASFVMPGVQFRTKRGDRLAYDIRVQGDSLIVRTVDPFGKYHGAMVVAPETSNMVVISPRNPVRATRAKKGS